MSGTDPTGYRFPKKEHLKRKQDVSRLFSVGSRFNCRGMRLVVRKNDCEEKRILFAPARSFGNAVQRNRIRRVAREIYRHNRARLALGYDLAIVVYPGDYSHEQRQEQMMYLWRTAGICTSGE